VLEAIYLKLWKTDSYSIVKFEMDIDAAMILAVLESIGKDGCNEVHGCENGRTLKVIRLRSDRRSIFFSPYIGLTQCIGLRTADNIQCRKLQDNATDRPTDVAKFISWLPPSNFS